MTAVEIQVAFAGVAILAALFLVGRHVAKPDPKRDRDR